jgi:hypothetical protein
MNTSIATNLKCKWRKTKMSLPYVSVSGTLYEVGNSGNSHLEWKNHYGIQYYIETSNENLCLRNSNYVYVPLIVNPADVQDIIGSKVQIHGQLIPTKSTTGFCQYDLIACEVQRIIVDDEYDYRMSPVYVEGKLQNRICGQDRNGHNKLDVKIRVTNTNKEKHSYAFNVVFWDRDAMIFADSILNTEQTVIADCILKNFRTKVKGFQFMFLGLQGKGITLGQLESKDS